MNWMRDLTGKYKILYIFVTVLILLVPAALCSCIPPGKIPPHSPLPTDQCNPSPSPIGRPFPRIVIIEPHNNSTLEGGDVTVTVKVTDFNMPGKYSGYIHYYMDVNPPHEAFKPAITDPGTYVSTTATSYTWKNVKPGKHTFSVQLVHLDHTPMLPVVSDKVIVRVAASGKTR